MGRFGTVPGSPRNDQKKGQERSTAEADQSWQQRPVECQHARRVGKGDDVMETTKTQQQTPVVEIMLSRRAYKSKPTTDDVRYYIKDDFRHEECIVQIPVDKLSHLQADKGMSIISAVCFKEGGYGTYIDKDGTERKEYNKSEHFIREKLFLLDIDNANKDKTQITNPVTPEQAREILEKEGLRVNYMYSTFSNSESFRKFRIALVSDEYFTDKEERDAVGIALVRLFPQAADQGCKDAVRISFGSNQGVIYQDYTAVCSKESLLKLADKFKDAKKDTKKQKSTGTKTIPVGERHGTLLSFANAMRKKYGPCEHAYEEYRKRVKDCENLKDKPEEEIMRIWRDACEFQEKEAATNPDYVPPDDYNSKLEPADYTDLGQADVFVDIYGSKVRYSKETGFLWYDGKVWKDNPLKVQAYAQELTARQLKDALSKLSAAQSSNADKETRKAQIEKAESYLKYVRNRRSSKSIYSTLTEIQPKLAVDPKELDADPYILNTPAGAVDLRTGKLHEHSPWHYCTKITGVSPDNTNIEMWYDFLKRVTVNDKELENYLQEVAGMSVIGMVLKECMVVAHGSGGNGKSTLFNVESKVLGDYSGMLSAEALTVNCKKNKSPEKAELRGKRLVIASELEEGLRLDTAMVKQLCSTDQILAEPKYLKPFHFTPSHTLVLFTNHLPRVGSTDKGTWDRLIIVPFLASFRGMKGEVKNYADYLFRNCGGAVLSWMIEGAKKFIENDCELHTPDAVNRASAEYLAENDWLNQFIEAKCDVNPEYIALSGELYDEYREWCGQTKNYIHHVSDFRAALIAAGYVAQRTHSGRVIKGLRVKPPLS